MTTAPPITLADFILARIGEDEAAATLVSSAPPTWSMTTWPHDGERIPVEIAARTFDPARVLAECEAHRAVIAETAGWRHEDHCAVSLRGDVFGGESCDCARDLRVDRVLRLLALPYAAHPDFRDEWRP